MSERISECVWEREKTKQQRYSDVRSGADYSCARWLNSGAAVEREPRVGRRRKIKRRKSHCFTGSGLCNGHVVAAEKTCSRPAAPWLMGCEREYLGNDMARWVASCFH